MKTINTLKLTLTTCAALVSQTLLAEDISIDMDFYEPGYPATGTVNKISVTYFSGDEKLNFIGSVPHESGEMMDFNLTMTDRWQDKVITHFIVQTNGMDAFWIDELAFERGGYEAHFGMDGGLGWCLSTDPNDSHRMSAPSAGCYNALKFDLTTGGVYAAAPLDVRPQNYLLNIDCYDGGLLHDESGDDIRVTYWQGNVPVGTKSKKSTCSMDRDDVFWTNNTADITHFTLEATGSDELWVDEVFLQANQEHLQITNSWGQDGGMGWCLSTDPADTDLFGFGPNAGCFSKLKFDLITGGVYPVASADGSDAVTISKQQADFVLNRDYDNNTNGGKINLWHSNGHDSQKWKFADEVISSFSADNYCLNLHNNDITNGAEINLWECNGHASQKWIREGATIRLKQNPNYCLNLHYNDHSNDAIINLWQCNGHDSQNWNVN